MSNELEMNALDVTWFVRQGGRRRIKTCIFLALIDIWSETGVLRSTLVNLDRSVLVLLKPFALFLTYISLSILANFGSRSVNFGSARSILVYSGAF